MTHSETEDHAWTINVGDHPARVDSPEYVRSRKLMIKAVQLCQPWYFGDAPYQDHHGGGCWVFDGTKPYMFLLMAGIEWSAQFCADPAKVDLLRQQAEVLVAAFPKTEAWYTEVLGMSADDLAVLHTQITDANGVALWTDSFWNASVPLPAHTHTGVLPAGGGYHHYPKPIVDIELFKHDDFNLFVTLPDGTHAAVVPVAPRGSGNADVQVVYARHGSKMGDLVNKMHDAGSPVVVTAGSDISNQAFKNQ